MFRYEYPKFENKQVLRADMLGLLSDSQKHTMQLLYQGYGNGIISGCELSWNEGWLRIDSGIVHWNGHLYCMEEPYRLECGFEDQLCYLVIKFKSEKKQPNRTTGEGEIYLRGEPARTQDEMELCRFRLQEGSRLRSVYKDFRDFSTEYDTINIIHAPFVGRSGTILHPSILMRFAEEMMEMEMTDAFDVSFVMNVLANDGHVGRNAVRQYLKKSTGKDVADKNGELYQGLLNGLANRKPQRSCGRQEDEIQKKVMLM